MTDLFIGLIFSVLFMYIGYQIKKEDSRFSATLVQASCVVCAIISFAVGFVEYLGGKM